MSIGLEIKLKRLSKIYHEGELLAGVVQITCGSETKHEGIVLTMDGVVNLQLSNKNFGIFEAFYNSVKPIQLLSSTLDLSTPGKLSAGLSEFHFEFPLSTNKEPKILYETYHGVFVNINYQLKCEVKRNFLAKSVQKVQQFCMQYKPEKEPSASSEVNFSISPETLQKTAKERISIPRFLITGKLDKTECCVTKPFTGIELLAGVVQITCGSETKHEGIVLTMDGVVNLQLSNKNFGIFEAFYNSVKPIQLLSSTLDLSTPGKLSAGLSEFHFEFPLSTNKEPKILYETYHGVFVNINYQLKCEVKRNFLAKSVQKVQQFCMQYKPEKEPSASSEVNFSISPETLQKTAKERISIPRFLITGKLDKTECCVTKPFTGIVTVQHTEVAIKSIEIQLVRVETCGCAEGYSRDATEIQNIQIADGNVCPKLQIPIFMIFPRLFTCPTLITKNFKVEFEVNLVIVFKDDYLVTENFQIVLKRCN